MGFAEGEESGVGEVGVDFHLVNDWWNDCV